jgi:hypothetical protein
MAAVFHALASQPRRDMLGRLAGGGTHLTLVHERLDDLAAARPDVAEQVGAGWDFVLTGLAAVLASSPE